MYTAYIGLGSNLGDRRQWLQDAVDRIAAFGRVTAVSQVYETEPVGLVSEFRFLNAAAELATADDPEQLLKRLKRAERGMGRPTHTHLKDRQIDLDILMYEGLYFHSGNVEVPHPALEQRRFALAPLSDIASEMIHPLAGMTVKALLDRCPDRSAVIVTSLTLLLPS